MRFYELDLPNFFGILGSLFILEYIFNARTISLPGLYAQRVGPISCAIVASWAQNGDRQAVCLLFSWQVQWQHCTAS